MVKYLAIAAVFAGCTALGILYSQRLNSRLKLLEELLAFIRRLEIEMRYAGMPLTQAIHAAGKKARNAAQIFFDTLAHEVDGKSGVQVEDIFHRLLSEKTKTDDVFSSLNKSDFEILTDFSKNLGATDWENQKKNFEHIENNMQSAITAASENYKKKAKMYRTMGVLGGLFVAILLI